MPLSKKRLHSYKAGCTRRTKSILPEKIDVPYLERCKICGSVAHFYRIDGWYYAQCYKDKTHRGQMFRTSMEALTDWNQYNGEW